jgi:hypothetical protein
MCEADLTMHNRPLFRVSSMRPDLPAAIINRWPHARVDVDPMMCQFGIVVRVKAGPLARLIFADVLRLHPDAVAIL